MCGATSSGAAPSSAAPPLTARQKRVTPMKFFRQRFIIYICFTFRLFLSKLPPLGPPMLEHTVTPLNQTTFEHLGYIKYIFALGFCCFGSRMPHNIICTFLSLQRKKIMIQHVIDWRKWHKPNMM
jgi:hypothetical protein